MPGAEVGTLQNRKPQGFRGTWGVQKPMDFLTGFYIYIYIDRMCEIRRHGHISAATDPAEFEPAQWVSMKNAVPSAWSTGRDKLLECSLANCAPPST